MNKHWCNTMKQLAAQSDSWLDKFYLRMAALPEPWTFVATIILVAALVGLGAWLAW